MYHYRQLDRGRKEIRLLVLDPGSGTDIIRCSLQHVFLDHDHKPLYETISYVCGDPHARATIILNDTEVKVLESSEAVLRRMRLKDKSRTLWIDSICINQYDNTERNHQVGMMYQIYTNTFRNLVWLGDDDGHTAKAIDSIRMILEDIDGETRDSVKLQDLLWDERGQRQYSLTEFSFDFEGSSLAQLFRSPWFFRLWIVQEASLAPSSLCHRGKYEIPLIDVLRVAAWLRYKWLALPILTFQEGVPYAAAIFDSADKDCGYFHHFSGDQKMGNLLLDLMDFQALNPRDHVFAVLGLWQRHAKSTELPSVLEPDYTLSIQTVFRNVTRFAIQEGRNLNPLAWDRGPRKGTEPKQWPSWVPRLDYSNDRVNEAPTLKSMFRADAGVPMRLTDDSDRPDVLSVSGFVLDEVIRAVPAIKLGARLSEVQGYFVRMEHPESGCWVVSPDGGIEAKVGMTLLAGVNNRKAPALDTEAKRGYQAYKTYLAHNRAFPPYERDLPVAASESDKIAACFQEAMANAAFHRFIFHTKYGHVGLGPPSIQADDFVVILYGSRWPVVMRYTGTDFILVGMAYVYGIMDGEAVRRHQAKGMSDSIFRIV
jgi:hypothetical protein